jgi:hypothetical protein
VKSEWAPVELLRLLYNSEKKRCDGRELGIASIGPPRRPTPTPGPGRASRNIKARCSARSQRIIVMCSHSFIKSVGAMLTYYGTLIMWEPTHDDAGPSAR